MQTPQGRLGNGCYSHRNMKSPPSTLEQQLASLYDEPVTDAEAALMAHRLTNFVELLLDIEAERQGEA